MIERGGGEEMVERGGGERRSREEGQEVVRKEIRVSTREIRDQGGETQEIERERERERERESSKQVRVSEPDTETQPMKAVRFETGTGFSRLIQFLPDICSPLLSRPFPFLFHVPSLQEIPMKNVNPLKPLPRVYRKFLRHLIWKIR